MQTFTGVYGVGPATAKKWIKSGIACIEDAVESADTLARHDARISAGNGRSLLYELHTSAITTFGLCLTALI